MYCMHITDLVTSFVGIVATVCFVYKDQMKKNLSKITSPTSSYMYPNSAKQLAQKRVNDYVT